MAMNENRQRYIVAMLTLVILLLTSWFFAISQAREIYNLNAKLSEQRTIIRNYRRTPPIPATTTTIAATQETTVTEKMRLELELLRLKTVNKLLEIVEEIFGVKE